MTVKVASAAAGFLFSSFHNGDLKNQNPSATAKKSNRRRRKQKKNHNSKSLTGEDNDSERENTNPQQLPAQVEIEYVPEKPEFDGLSLDEFKEIIEKFTFKETIGLEENGKKEETKLDKKNDSDSDDEENPQEKATGGISNKPKKLERRMKLAALKQISSRPDIVEVWDAASSDPKLLVLLKSCRNTVQVPRHWCQKRKFLQAKRGIEKPPFQLPHFIAATGIEKHRQAYNEKEDSRKLKQKQREKMQPKMGKMDIDYQVLHDAFFKFQTKPKLTKHGDLYYEGKEFETRFRDVKPGMLSHELREALGMPDGAPPPWLINMQRYGPPPSYPDLKIPGLNAPIPPGAKFGYQPGEWGNPPVDEHKRPLYGDVFGVLQNEEPNYEEDEPVDKSRHWGDLEDEEEEDDDNDEEEETVEEEVMEDGIESVESLSDRVDDVIDIRKRKEEDRPLFQVLDEKEANIDRKTFFGTSHTYAVPGANRVDLLRSQKTGNVDVTLALEDLEEIDDVLPAKYEAAREADKLRNQPEDFSDMVAEDAKKRKRKMQEKDSRSKKKAYKF